MANQAPAAPVANFDVSTASADDILNRFFDAAFRDDPFSHCGRLVELGPIHKAPFGPWFVVGFDAAVEALHDMRLLNARAGDLLQSLIESSGAEGGMAQDLVRKLLVFVDPPEHTRIRRIVSKAFSLRAIQRLQDVLTEITEETLNALEDAAADGRPVPLVQEYTHPMPMRAICKLLAIPDEDYRTFRGWADDLVKLAEGVVPTPELVQKAEESAQHYIAYEEKIFAERRANPGPDLLSAILGAEDEGDRLSHQEVRELVLSLIMAGNETTVGFLGNAILALLDNPEQRQRLVDDPTIAPHAIEELLRYSGSAIVVTRTADEDLEIAGTPIKEGEQVFIALIAADRDPRHFPDPHKLDFSREDVSNLALGRGTHFCLGNALARLQSQIALPMLFQRFPDLELSEPVQWRPTYLLRGPEEIYARLRPN